jgi:peptidoglycan hydrolase-like protein with peptidoglycan-binding domain
MRTRLIVLVSALAVLVVPPSAAAVTNVQIAGLQVALRAHGLYDGPIDGVAGPKTAAAVRAFQRRSRITVDGIAGIQTRVALGKLGRPLFGRRTLRAGMAGWDVSVLQFLLRRDGDLACELDGRFGPMTAAAVRRFQRKSRLAVDGIAGPATMVVLDPSGRRPSRGPTPHTFAVAASLNRWARHYGVDAALVRALAWQESGHQGGVVSAAGAFGVMQVTPATWDFVETVLVGGTVPRTIDGNVRVGTAFLAHLLRQFKGDVRLALAAYYRGPAAVRRYGVGPETSRFVANVLALRSRV